VGRVNTHKKPQKLIADKKSRSPPTLTHHLQARLKSQPSLCLFACGLRKAEVGVTTSVLAVVKEYRGENLV